MTAGKPMEAAKTFKVLKLAGGEFIPTESSLVIEKELPLYVNGEHLATASVVPSMEKEFVVGYLFGQGFIDRAREIATLKITEKGATADLVRADPLSSRETKASYRSSPVEAARLTSSPSPLPEYIPTLKSIDMTSSWL